MMKGFKTNDTIIRRFKMNDTEQVYSDILILFFFIKLFIFIFDNLLVLYFAYIFDTTFVVKNFNNILPISELYNKFNPIFVFAS